MRDGGVFLHDLRSGARPGAVSIPRLHDHRLTHTHAHAHTHTHTHTHTPELDSCCYEEVNDFKESHVESQDRLNNDYKPDWINLQIWWHSICDVRLCVRECVCVCVCVSSPSLSSNRRPTRSCGCSWGAHSCCPNSSSTDDTRSPEPPRRPHRSPSGSTLHTHTHTHTHTGLHPNPNPYPNLTQSDFIPTKFSNREQKHVYTHTHKNQLTNVVCAAELWGNDVFHVAMETEEDLNRVNLHLQSAGQVHHLTHTHTHTVVSKVQSQQISTTLILDSKHWTTTLIGRRVSGVTLRSSGGWPSTMPYQASSLCQASAGTNMKSSFSTRRSFRWYESRSENRKHFSQSRFKPVAVSQHL